ncbi:MAG TPA: metalloregulator ArsR/SmtB family transcription factor [Acidimicrobiales bacterium]
MVVDYQKRSRLDEVFYALADPTRRSIVEKTFQRDYSISELARQFPMSFAAVQKHVAVLERAELVSKRRHGREQIVRSNVAAIRRAEKFLGRYEELWRHRIEQMSGILDEDTK